MRLLNHKSILFTAMMCFVSTMLFAQNFDYLREAYKRVEDGDCDRAQKLYNVYKEMESKNDIKLEGLIKECQNSNKQYRIGDMIEIDGNRYPIAYIDITGQHGYAIAEEEVQFYFSKKSTTETEKYDGVYYYTIKKGFIDSTQTINKAALPQKWGLMTEDELRYVYNNKSLIGINGIGEYCLSEYIRRIRKLTKEDYDNLSITKTYTALYEFTFFDFNTGETEKKQIDHDFRTQSIVKISF